MEKTRTDSKKLPKQIFFLTEKQNQILSAKRSKKKRGGGGEIENNRCVKEKVKRDTKTVRRIYHMIEKEYVKAKTEMNHV